MSGVLRVLEECSSMRELKQIQGHAISQGLARFSFISSKLLAFCARNDLGYAHTVFSHIPHPTLFDYNTLISPSLFLQMLNHLRPNSLTFTFLLSKSSLTVFFLQQLHSHILRLGHLTDLYVVTSLLTAYSNHGFLNHARDLFDAIPHRNINQVSYSAMVSGYVKNGCFRDGINLFRRLKNNDFPVKPNNSLLVSVLSACAAVGAFEEGKWIHSYVDQNGAGGSQSYDLQLGTALIDFYTKCGCLEPACRVFADMKTKDVAAWSAMILGLAINAKNHEALRLFEDMERVGPRPNAVTFLAALTACNHPHLFARTLKLFRHMTLTYGIVASIEHYGCVVHVLARSGNIQEALAFIKNMAVEADGAIWGSLLNGCLFHGYVELGLKIGEYLLELEPGHSGRYVVLANLYARMGRWEGVLETRKLMKHRRVPAVSAWSFIEIHQIVHKFVVHDNSTPYSGEIYRVLNHLGKTLHDYG